MTTDTPDTPNPIDRELARELVDLAGRVRAWQEARKYSDNALLLRMPGLGSTKTFTRILKGDLDELDLDKQLANYRAVVAVMEDMSSRERSEEELYEDISTVTLLRRALVELIDERSIRRVVLVEGDSGLGKSKALALLQRKYGQRISVVEAVTGWHDNPNSFVGACLEAQGIRDMPCSYDGRLRMLIARYRAHRVALAIDEAHCLGPECLDTVKTLVNQTPIEVFLFAWPTLWRRLERGAYEEVKQLLGNRLAERIKLGGLREADVRKLLQRRAKVEDPRAAALVLKEASQRGNLSFVAAVCTRLASAERDGLPSVDDVAAAVAAEIAKR